MYDIIIDGCEFMLNELFYVKATATKLYKSITEFKEKMKKLTKTGWLNASNEDARNIVDEYTKMRKEFKDKYGY